jgi:hypothetical protein
VIVLVWEVQVEVMVILPEMDIVELQIQVVEVVEQVEQFQPQVVMVVQELL